MHLPLHLLCWGRHRRTSKTARVAHGAARRPTQGQQAPAHGGIASPGDWQAREGDCRQGRWHSHTAEPVLPKRILSPERKRSRAGRCRLRLCEPTHGPSETVLASYSRRANSLLWARAKKRRKFFVCTEFMVQGLECASTLP